MRSASSRFFMPLLFRARLSLNGLNMTTSSCFTTNIDFDVRSTGRIDLHQIIVERYTAEDDPLRPFRYLPVLTDARRARQLKADLTKYRIGVVHQNPSLLSISLILGFRRQFLEQLQLPISLNSFDRIAPLLGAVARVCRRVTGRFVARRHSESQPPLLVNRQCVAPNFLTNPTKRPKLLAKCGDGLSPHVQAMVDRRMVESEACPLQMALVDSFTKCSFIDPQLVKSTGNFIGILEQYSSAHNVSDP